MNTPTGYIDYDGHTPYERLGKFAKDIGVSRTEAGQLITSGKIRPGATPHGMRFSSKEIMGLQIKATVSRAVDRYAAGIQQGHFRAQFIARSTAEAGKGILRGVTVAEIGKATGHFAFLDTAGRVVCVGGAQDCPMGCKSVPLCMDAKSIETVIAAGKAAQRVKSREDHSDVVGARAGFVENFRAEGGKAVADLYLSESYRNREIVLETAKTSPELMGLSGDFKFTAEIINGCAMMRVSAVDAVDIVDQGALTPNGLFQ